MRALKEWQPHIALLDLELVTEGLLSLLGPQPGGGFKIPVFGLTRRGDLKTKLEAFDMGVDDIMSMPISPEELLARTLAVVRRAYGVKLPLRPVMRIDDIDFDILARRVTVGDWSCISQPRAELALSISRQQRQGGDARRNHGCPVGPRLRVREQRCRPAHCNFRAKLQNDWRRPRFIATVPGLGYRFLHPMAVQAKAGLTRLPSGQRRQHAGEDLGVVATLVKPWPCSRIAGDHSRGS